MEFSLFYFDGEGATPGTGKYQLLLDSAKFADRNGFTALWTPERHFHAFGGLYPNPSVITAALAMVTEQIQLRAGSVVLPLHDPVRVVEEWAVVDHLSQGRIALAFASGWTLDEFVLSRFPYEHRRDCLWSGIEQVMQLWQGETVEREDVTGRSAAVRTYPIPLQFKLPLWIAAQSQATFQKAGEIGANVLTSVLNDSVEEVAKKIQAYRQSLEQHGYDSSAGKVTLMLHTFLGPDLNTVNDQIEKPFTHYLKTHLDLLENLAKGLGLTVSLEDFTEDDMDSLVRFSLQSFQQGRALIGTPASCRPLVEDLAQIGVDELACLIDFNPDSDGVMASLPYLKELKDSCNDLSSERGETNNGANVDSDVSRDISPGVLV